MFTITGTDTHFTQGATTVATSAPTSLTFSNVVVTSATSMTVLASNVNSLTSGTEIALEITTVLAGGSEFAFTALIPVSSGYCD
jgi:hypothetical protein